MAIKLTGPAENSVLIDANITEIILEHTDNQEHYHYAKFYIDNVLFDELVIPRISTSKLVLQFSNFLLKTVAFPNVETDVIQAYRMDRNLKIEIFKNKNTIATLVNTFNYVLRYSTKPTLDKFDVDTWLNFIDVKAQVFVVNPKAKIVLPFYAKNTENISITVIDDNGLSLFNQEFYFTNSNTFVLQLDVDAPASSAYFALIIASGTVKIQKYFRILRNQIYKSKKIKFQNKFGFPILVEVFGKMATKDEFKYTIYKDGSSVLKMADIEEETTFSVDSGYLTENERSIISQIKNSLKTEIEHQGRFIECVSTTKSITTFTDGEFVTSNALTFEFNKNPKYKN